MTVQFETLRRRWIKDPKFRAEYERVGPEMNLAMTLAEARRKAGLSQAELAARMRTSLRSPPRERARRPEMADHRNATPRRPAGGAPSRAGGLNAMVISLIDRLKAHLQPREDYLRCFCRSEAQLKSWFKGEILLFLEREAAKVTYKSLIVKRGSTPRQKGPKESRFFSGIRLAVV